MERRIDRHPVMTQLISDQERIDRAVRASLETNRSIGRPGYIKFDEVLKAAPSWFQDTQGHALNELQRLNSSELWHGVFENVEFDSIALFDEGMLRRLCVNMPNDFAIDVIHSKTKGGFDHTLPLFGLAALMGESTYSYIDENDEDSSFSPVIEPAIEIGRRFETKAQSPEIFVERIKKLFPSKIKHGDGSAMDLLIEMRAFRRKSDPKYYCPAPRLVVMMLESFGRELENGYTQKLITPLSSDLIEQKA